MRVAILTLSDSGYQGRRDDKSGPVIREMVESSGYTVVHAQLLSDGVEPLRSVLRSLATMMQPTLFLLPEVQGSPLPI